MLVLGVETSCDETGLAFYDSARGLLGHRLYSQAAMHAEYGGVVPELASRSHVRKLSPVLKALLADCRLDLAAVDGVAYTAGPGLMGALLTGAAFARSLAWALGKPAIAVHHMEGHLLAPLLETPAPDFPFLALLVSGGHTLLVDVAGPGRYRVLGESVDDAAGEAFDKTAQILGLGYPGGPALARLAEKGRADIYTFPRPMLDRPNLNFSFSGLKTHVWQTVQAAADDEQTRADIARAFEEAVVEVLLGKTQRAIQQTGLTQVIVAGGVGANRCLRTRLSRLGEQENFKVFYPRVEFCTDNGAMIAFAGYLRLAAGQSSALEITARARWPLEALEPV